MREADERDFLGEQEQNSNRIARMCNWPYALISC
jgi:hypothetical protein